MTHRSVGPEQYGRFLIEVFEEWVRRDIGAVYVQMFDTALANWYGEPGGMCVHAETCGSSSPWSTPATCTPATTYVEPGYLLGNINDKHMLELIALPQQRQFGQDKRDTLTRYCRDCDVRFACNGGCPKDRFATSPYGEPGQHYLCPGYKDFFHHVDQADGDHGRAAPRRRGARRPDGRLRGRRTRGAAATTPAPAAAAANGSAATAPNQSGEGHQMARRMRTGKADNRRWHRAATDRRTEGPAAQRTGPSGPVSGGVTARTTAGARSAAGLWGVPPGPAQACTLDRAPSPGNPR